MVAPIRKPVAAARHKSLKNLIGGRGLILSCQHHRDGRSGVVYVEGAANGGQPDKARAAAVVANIERHRQMVATGAAAKDGETRHSQDIP
jgi:hypothetical protein